ncbi:hypothetical protein [Acinetobacter bereziniae]|uniref:hypothetical protein n=1 Tax=Acinetobacter bereziniae TaxID=106648 RepID=UPI0032B3F8D7
MSLKFYIFNNKYDHLYYFNYLIQEVLNFKDQFNVCLNDMIELERSLSKDSKITTLQFEALSRRKDGILRFLCNLLGDETKGALSFKKYRKRLKKDCPKYGITLPELPASISTQLNELNQLRNWSLHYPESLVISEKELLQHPIERIDVILNVRYRFYDKEYLTKMIEELNVLSEYFEDIFSQMLNDYELLIGQKVHITKIPLMTKEYAHMQQVARSWEIQNS